MIDEWTEADQKYFDTFVENEIMPIKWLMVMGLDETHQFMVYRSYGGCYTADKEIFDPKTLVRSYQRDKLKYK